MKDYYSILELTEQERNLSGEEFEKALKKKFRALCLKYHPDKQVGKSDSEKKAAEDKFKEINEAYSVLSDPNKKSSYDMFGTADGGQGFGGFGGMDADLEDLINQHMNMHFGGFSRRHTVTRGSDIRITCECTVEDVFNEATKKLRYARMVVCPDCGGSGSSDGKTSECPYCHGSGIETKVMRNGWIQSVTKTTCMHCGGSGKSIASPCGTCNGNGLVKDFGVIEFQIPHEIRDGYELRFDGRGNMAAGEGGVPGDLLVVFRVSKSGLFTLTNHPYDIYSKTSVGVLDCITGCDKQVKCIDGSSLTVHIPKGTKEGDLVTVKGKGMYKTETERGNMVIFIEQVMPTEIGKDEAKKLKELKKMKNFKQ